MFFLVLILESGHKCLKFPGREFGRTVFGEKTRQRGKCLPQALGPRDVTKPTSQVLEACSSSLSPAHA